VIIDQPWRQCPASAGVLEVADQFALFGIHADDGVAAALEAIPQVREIQKLLIVIGVEVSQILL
jgi:hypothetical protein